MEQKMKKNDWIEFSLVTSCLLFAMMISLYHISHEGYLGLTENQWGVIWGIAENILSLVMCIIIGRNTIGEVKNLFRWLFIPYFSLKIIYHFSCFSGIYFLAKSSWETIWSYAVVIILLSAMFYCLILTRRKNDQVVE
jgi:hypothetical protein